MKKLFPVACVLVPFTVACGSSSGDGKGTGGTDSNPDPNAPADTSTCDPDADIPCIKDIAEPCQDFDTGWPGDEYCLAVPDPSIGMQIHTGPTEYDNPDNYGPYVLEPGAETNWAEVSETPNAEDVWVNGYYSFMRPGSHHFILFSLPRDTYQAGTQSTGNGAESAVGALDGEFRAGATKAIQGAVLTADDPSQQAGSIMEHQQPIAMNLHFINTGDQPLIQEIWVNFHLIDRADIKRWLKPITWFGGLTMSIPPGTEQTLRNPDDSCLIPTATDGTTPPDVQVTVMTGHVHANTVRVEATRTRNGAEETLFEDYDWHDPTQFMFLPGYEYPTPDPSAKTAGVGASGILPVEPGDSYNWECEVHNQQDVTLTFGNQVYTGEMCMVFGFYSSPVEATNNWFCAF